MHLEAKSPEYEIIIKHNFSKIWKEFEQNFADKIKLIEQNLTEIQKELEGIKQLNTGIKIVTELFKFFKRKK